MSSNTQNAADARKVTILGSTGSIGVSTLDVLEHAEQTGAGSFNVVALSANTNVELIAEQAKKFRPDFVALADESKRAALEAAMAPLGIRCGGGRERGQ